MIQKLLKTVSQTIACLCLVASVPLYAEEFVVPSMRSPVTDLAGILSSNTQQQIETLSRSLYESGGSQIAVLTLPSLGDLTIEEVGIKVVDQWKLGRQDKDDGVLLLIAPNDRRVRIEVGRGKEGELTDALSRRIINDVIAPAFRVRDFDGGILNAVVTIVSITDPQFKLEEQGFQRARVGRRSERLSLPQGIVVVILLLIFFVFTIVSRVLGFSSGHSRYRGGSHYGGWGGGGFGSGGGGSSWGGGGGGFGGGGSSGSW